MIGILKFAQLCVFVFMSLCVASSVSAQSIEENRAYCFIDKIPSVADYSYKHKDAEFMALSFYVMSKDGDPEYNYPEGMAFGELLLERSKRKYPDYLPVNVVLEKEDSLAIEFEDGQKITAEFIDEDHILVRKGELSFNSFGEGEIVQPFAEAILMAQNPAECTRLEGRSYAATELDHVEWYRCYDEADVFLCEPDPNGPLLVVDRQGDFTFIDIGSPVDGPALFVRDSTKEVVAQCGGYCMNAESDCSMCSFEALEGSANE